MVDLNDFIESIRQLTGYAPSVNDLKPGKVIRFATSDKRDDKSGWCILFDDQEGGAFGCWRQGIESSWQARRQRSPEEMVAFKEKVTQARQKAETLEAEARAECRRKSEKIWSKAGTDDSHAYLETKHIKAHGVRQSGENLLVPVRNSEGVLQGLQIISPGGSKKFMKGTAVKGCYHSIGRPGSKLLIAEGYATAATLHECTGLAVACAFNAGNLKPVAEVLRAKLPDTTLIMCADDDCFTDGNPGLTKATEAARAVDGLLAVPLFPDNRGAKDTDFNDLARIVGADIVSNCIDKAGKPEKDAGNPDPIPLGRPEERAQSFPLDALPPVMAAAVKEYADYGQQPLPMIASAALSALSLAAQGLADVRRDAQMIGPIGIYSMVVAGSGERKSTADRFFRREIDSWLDDYRLQKETEIKEAHASHKAWEVKDQALREIHKKACAGSGKVNEVEAQARWIEHQKQEPIIPKSPQMFFADVNPASLGDALTGGHPSAALWTDEAMIVVGSSGVRDQAMSFFGMLNKLWDDGRYSNTRKTSGSINIRGQRMTANLMMQECIFRDLVAGEKGLARGSGTLARFLICQPESTIGSRRYRDLQHMPAMDSFHAEIRRLLQTPLSLDENGNLNPHELCMSNEAKKIWIEFQDCTEAKLGKDADYECVKDFGAKAPENAARLAALFHLLEYGPDGTIDADTMEKACCLAMWYLCETRRLFSCMDIPQDHRDAQSLLDWALKKHGTSNFSASEILQYGPRCVRKKSDRDRILRLLTEHNLILPANTSNSLWAINPSCQHLEEAA